MSDLHAPVLLDEVVQWLEPRDGGLYVDGTFGAGGYTRALLAVEGARVLGVDRDPAAHASAEAVSRAYPKRFAFAGGAFSVMADIVEAAGSSGVDGVVLDLGVSSMQIDQPGRGFSFQKDGPLDMRMSSEGPSAADAVNHLDLDDLASIFRVYGEEKRARRAAQFIVEARAEAAIDTTGRLSEIVSRAVGVSKTSRIHPATRVFQALRIYVNDELGELARGLMAAEQVLKPAGRLVVVSFHSLEDRMVKTFMRERSGLVARGSRHLPETAPGPEPSFTLLTRKAIEPSEAEARANPRARSAKLRAAARTHAPAHIGVFTPPGGVTPYERLLEIRP